MDKKLIGIYMNDHLAGHVAGLELAKRTASNNEGTPLGEWLDTFVVELQEEKEIMEHALDAFDSNPDRVKTMAAWVAEKAGRLKLNGQVTGYSPLSRVLEIETMANGVASKIDLWNTLKSLNVPVDRSPDELIERAERQREYLQQQRERAVAEAFTA